MPLMLTQEDEMSLARRWRDFRDVCARNRLVEAHLPLANSLARRCKNHGVSTDDLEQEAALGLMKAADGFDPERGIRFSTFARWWVKSFLQEYVLRTAIIIRPGTSSQLAREFRKGKREFGFISLDAPLKGNEDGTVADAISDPAPLPDEIVEQTIDGERHSRALKVAIGKLTQRERTIVEQRHMSEEWVTLADLAGPLGLSKERIRQVEMKAINKLRESMGA